MEVDVKLAGPDDVGAMARSLGRAFGDDPIFEHLIPGVAPEERASRTTPFFAVAAHGKVRSATAWTTPAGEGAALWATPGRWRTSVRDFVALTWPILRATRRHTLRALTSLTAVGKAHPSEPHWYLSTLGTDPDNQGRGIGGALLGPVLARCDTQRLPAYLESSKASNVPYYERFGFRVTGEIPLGRGGPLVWPMWREPA